MLQKQHEEYLKNQRESLKEEDGKQKVKVKENEVKKETQELIPFTIPQNDAQKNEKTKIKVKFNHLFNKQKKLAPPLPPVNEVSPPNVTTIQNNQDNFMSNLNRSNNANNTTAKLKKVRKARPGVHSSVRKIRTAYPGITLPPKCLKWNLDPEVKIDKDFVKNWLADYEKTHKKDETSWSVNKSGTSKIGICLTKVSRKTKSTESECDNFDIESNHSGADNRSDASCFSPLSSDSEESDYEPSVCRIGKRAAPKTRASARKRVKTSETPTENAVPAHLVAFTPISAPQSSTVVQQPKNDRLQVLSDLIQHDKTMGETGSSSNSIKPPSDDNTSLLIETSHASKTFICQTCNKIFDTSRSLYDHKRQHHKNSLLKCQICGKNFQIVEELVKHNLDKHVKPTEESPISLSSSPEISTSQKRVAKKRTHPSKKDLLQRAQIVQDNSTNVALKDTNLNDYGIFKENDYAPLDHSANVQDKEHVHNSANEQLLPKDNSTNNAHVPNNIGHVPSKDNSTKYVPLISTSPAVPTHVEQYVISSDEEPDNTEPANVDPPYAALGSNVNKMADVVLIDDNASSDKSDNSSVNFNPTKDPLQGNSELTSSGENRLNSLSIADEELYLKNVFSKHKSKSEKTAESKPLPSNTWILKGIGGLLDRAFIPVETVPSVSTEPCFSVKYSFAKGNSPKSKNAAYKWNSSEAIDVSTITKPDKSTSAHLPDTVVINDIPVETSQPVEAPVTTIAHLPPQQTAPSNGLQSNKHQLVAKFLPNGNLELTETSSKLLKTLTQLPNAPQNGNVLRPLVPKTVPTTIQTVSTVIQTVPTTIQTVPTVIQSAPTIHFTPNSVPQVMPVNPLYKIVNPSLPANSQHHLNGGLNRVLYQQNDQLTNVSVQNYISINLPKTSLYGNNMNNSSQIRDMTSAVQAITSSAEQNSGQNSVEDQTQVTTTKPLLRIKNLSELTDGHYNKNSSGTNRSSLQNMYARTVSDYVSNISDGTLNSSRNTLDEYLQI